MKKLIFTSFVLCLITVSANAQKFQKKQANAKQKANTVNTTSAAKATTQDASFATAVSVSDEYAASQKAKNEAPVAKKPVAQRPVKKSN